MGRKRDTNIYLSFTKMLIFSHWLSLFGCQCVKLRVGGISSIFIGGASLTNKVHHTWVISFPFIPLSHVG